MEIIYTDTKPDNIKVIFVNKEMEAAHEDYLNRRRDILYNLEDIIDNDEIPTLYRNWINKAYRFIKEEM